MSVKKGKWSPIKEILFSYLAISKILYWLNTITAMNQSGLDGVFDTVFIRLVEQDIPIILSVIVFFFLDKLIVWKKSKYGKLLENVVFYVVGYIALMGVVFIYSLILHLLFGPVQVDSWGQFIGYLTLAYLVVAAVLNIKLYFKTKAAPEYALPAKSADDKVTMLKILLDDGVLTQEEFDQKKAKLCAGESV